MLDSTIKLYQLNIPELSGYISLFISGNTITTGITNYYINSGAVLTGQTGNFVTIPVLNSIIAAEQLFNSFTYYPNTNPAGYITAAQSSGAIPTGNFVYYISGNAGINNITGFEFTAGNGFYSLDLTKGLTVNDLTDNAIYLENTISDINIVANNNVNINGNFNVNSTPWFNGGPGQINFYDSSINSNSLFFYSGAVYQLSNPTDGVSVDIFNRLLVDSTQNDSIDWQNRYLINLVSDSQVLDWSNCYLIRPTSFNDISLDWKNYLLLSAGNTSLDWNHKILSGNWTAQTLSISGSNVVLSSQTGAFGGGGNTGALTGAFYPLNTNPSNYLTGFNSGLYTLNSNTGIFATSLNLAATGTTLQGEINILNSWSGHSTGLYIPLTANGTLINIGSVQWTDTNIFSIQSPQAFYNDGLFKYEATNTLAKVYIGDWNIDNNGTYILVDDYAQSITLTKPIYSNTNKSIDTVNRLLFNNNSIESLDWNNNILTGNWLAQQLTISGNNVLTGFNSGIYITTGQTGAFAIINPNIVYTTGNQFIGGNKYFTGLMAISGGAGENTYFSQKTNGEFVWGLNVNSLNGDAIDFPGDSAFKLGMQTTNLSNGGGGYNGLHLQTLKAGSGTWSNSSTIWTIDTTGNMAITGNLYNNGTIFISGLPISNYFYPLSTNPAGYITTSQTGGFASIVNLALTGATLQNEINLLNTWTGNSNAYFAGTAISAFSGNNFQNKGQAIFAYSNFVDPAGGTYCSLKVSTSGQSSIAANAGGVAISNYGTAAPSYNSYSLFVNNSSITSSGGIGYAIYSLGGTNYFAGPTSGTIFSGQNFYSGNTNLGNLFVTTGLTGQLTGAFYSNNNPANYSYSAINEGLIVHYPFSEISGSGAINKVTNAVSTMVGTGFYTSGIIGGAMGFNQDITSSYIQGGETGTYYAGQTPISMFAWINLTGISTNNNNIIIHKWNGNFASEFYFTITSAGGVLQFSSVTNSGARQNPNVSLPYSVIDSNWHSIGCTYDGLSTKFYVDGNFVGASAAQSGQLVANPTQPYTIGGLNAAQYGPGYNPLGSIASPRIWSRIISANEMNYLNNEFALVNISSNFKNNSISGNSGYFNNLTLKGNTVITGGPYYLNSNPSGFITGFNSGLYTLNSQTGIFITTSQTSNFVKMSGNVNPLKIYISGYVNPMLQTNISGPNSSLCELVFGDEYSSTMSVTSFTGINNGIEDSINMNASNFSISNNTYGDGFFNINPNGQIWLGDYNGDAYNTYFLLDDSTQMISINGILTLNNPLASVFGPATLDGNNGESIVLQGSSTDACALQLLIPGSPGYGYYVFRNAGFPTDDGATVGLESNGNSNGGITLNTSYATSYLSNDGHMSFNGGAIISDGTNLLSTYNTLDNGAGHMTVHGSGNFNGGLYVSAKSVITSGSWNNLTDTSTTTWTVTQNLVEDRKILILTGNSTLSITGLYNGWCGALTTIQSGTSTTGYTLTLPVGTKVANAGSGQVILTPTSGAVDLIGFTYNGLFLMANISNNFT